MRRDGRQQSDTKQSVSSAIHLLAAKREARLQALAAATTANSTGTAVTQSTGPRATAAAAANGAGQSLLDAASVQLPADESSSEEDISDSQNHAQPVRGSGSTSTSQPLSRLVRHGTGGNSSSSSSRAATDLDSLLDQMAGIGIDDTSLKTSRPSGISGGTHIVQPSSAHGSTAAAAVLHSDNSTDDDSTDDERDKETSDSAAHGASHQRHQPAAVCPTAAAGPSNAAEAAADSEVLVLEGGFELPGRIAGMLYAHQLEGVRWLWSLQRVGKGGILGDDMGLGKTMQVCAMR